MHVMAPLRAATRNSYCVRTNGWRHIASCGGQQHNTTQRRRPKREAREGTQLALSIRPQPVQLGRGAVTLALQPTDSRPRSPSSHPEAPPSRACHRVIRDVGRRDGALRHRRTACILREPTHNGWWWYTTAAREPWLCCRWNRDTAHGPDQAQSLRRSCVHTYIHTRYVVQGRR